MVPMINLPSDTLPKLITFLGIAIVAPCAIEQHQMIQRLETASMTFASSAAEAKELWAQRSSAMQESTKRLGEAADAYARRNAFTKQGLASQAAVENSIGDLRSAEASAYKIRSEAAQARIDQKEIEVAKNLAIATSLGKSSNGENIVLMIAMAGGAALFSIGLAQWARAEKKPSAFRRVTRKRGQ